MEGIQQPCSPSDLAKAALPAAVVVVAVASFVVEPFDGLCTVERAADAAGAAAAVAVGRKGWSVAAMVFVENVAPSIDFVALMVYTGCCKGH